MSASSTLRFLRSGFSGSQTAGRSRASWGGVYWSGCGLPSTDDGYAGTVIKTRRGTVVQTGGSIAGKSRADSIRLMRIPSVTQRAKDCIQACWGIPNKSQYAACRAACICRAGYVSTCAALKLSQSS